MYLACRDIKLEPGKVVPIGKPVPEAFSWSYPVLVAHLNLGWIKWSGDLPEPTPLEVAQQGMKILEAKKPEPVKSEKPKAAPKPKVEKPKALKVVKPNKSSTKKPKKTGE